MDTPHITLPTRVIGMQRADCLVRTYLILLSPVSLWSTYATIDLVKLVAFWNFGTNTLEMQVKVTGQGSHCSLLPRAAQTAKSVVLVSQGILQREIRFRKHGMEKEW